MATHSTIALNLSKKYYYGVSRLRKFFVLSLGIRHTVGAVRVQIDVGVFVFVTDTGFPTFPLLRVGVSKSKSVRKRSRENNELQQPLSTKILLT